MKKLIFTLFVLSWVLGGCDLTNLNKDTKAPVDIAGNPLFSRAQVTMGNFLTNGAAYAAFKDMPQQWTTTSYPTIPNYYINTYSIPDNIWSTLYSSVLVNLKIAKDKVQKDEVLTDAQKNNELACIDVMNVLAYSSLVDIFGNIPYKEALNPDNAQPAFDDAKTIYVDLLSRLNTAIGNFDPSATGFGSSDIIYSGDIGKWIKFANSLKMRLAITIADVDNATAKKAIEEASPHAFTSNDDNALIHFQSTPPNTNPVWEALVQSGRHDNIPAEPFISRMNNQDDPRRAVFFTKHNGAYVGGPIGVSNDYGAFSHFSDLIKEKTQPGIILGDDEIEFIRAEAAERGYNVGGSAASYYKKGIKADMQYWGISDSKISSYLAQPSVAYTSAAGDYRQKIGLQKWYALFTQGLQAWTEVRRLDSPTLQPSSDAAIDQYIKRFTYPSDAQNLNEANYNKASSAIGGDELTTKIFWDVNL